MSFDLKHQTTEPRAFSGEIGKALQDCETLAVVNFNPIMTLDALSFDFESSDLSSDQKYRAEICQAIASGKFSKSLQAKYPGNMSHSRWLTTANRILRLYASLDQV